MIRSNLIPFSGGALEGNALMQEALALYQQGTVMPNAFEHTLEELQSLCMDSFRRLEDPAGTLLKLR